MPVPGTVKMKANTLTPQLSLRFTVLPENTLVEISGRSEFKRELYLDLTVASPATQEQDMRLWRCLLIDDEYFCVISYPKSIDGDEPVTQLFVLKVADQNHLMTISTEIFSKVEAKCRKAVDEWSMVAAPDVVGVLGEFSAFEV